MNLILIVLGKLVLFISRAFNLGSGSTWPGHIATETNPRFIRNILKQNQHLKIVLVAGTNGKTTTSLMLQKMLEESKLRVFRNKAGANLLNGIASAIIEHSSTLGKLDYDVAIFETDENNFPLALKETQPCAVLLLNLFRDQLDRYGEVNTIAKHWEESLSDLTHEAIIFTNGDDPKLSHILENSRLVKYYFSIGKGSMIKDKSPYDVDFTYCPKCQTKLEYSMVSYSHLGKFKCPNCKFENPTSETFPSLPHPLFGTYNIYNTNAAALVAKIAFNVSENKIGTALKELKPAFGRQEEITYKDRKIVLLLSKNPAGFNQSIDAVCRLNKKGNILLILNDRIPDGRDISWIWDVDYENLPQSFKVFISGDRAYDMGIRIRYLNGRDQNTQVHLDLGVALEKAVDATAKNETLFILPTYSAMLEARKILTGKKIL